MFDTEKMLLNANGLQYFSYVKSNLEMEEWSFLEKVSLPFRVIWSIRSYREIKKLLKEHKPDLAHFHNTFPLISPSAYYACKELGVPVVQTLHNHRLFCPGGYFLRNGALCKECVEKSLWCSVKSACYHNSKIQTAGLAAMLYIHRKLGTWEKKVDCYITLTEFAKKLYSGAGLHNDKIVVKPNFVEDFGRYSLNSKGYGVFIGRLGEEKGVLGLVTALKQAGDPSFKFIGDGPLRNDAMNAANAANLTKTEFLGYKQKEETLAILGEASFLALPSVCYEGFPMVILEALSMGKPVITTDLGGLPEIVKDNYNGFLVPPKDTSTLAEKMKLLYDDKDLCLSMGRNARKEYEEKYTPEKNYEMLMNIYDKVMRRSKRLRD